MNEVTRRLEAAGVETARLDAEVLLAFCLKCDRLEFLKNPDLKINKNKLSRYAKLIERRLEYEPVAYITGRKEFWSFTLEVNKDVLIPRPDTEIIVEEALAIGKKIIAPRIVDIGTGSGAIALALAKELPEAEITATDISPAALKIAKKNARNLKLEKNIEFFKGDLFAPVKGLFDIIASNPPYISAAEYENLPHGVKDFEPQIALLAGQTGVEFYEKLIYQKDGWLLMEIGAPQAEKILDIMKECAFFENIDVRRDYAGHDRVIKGRKI
ncbi:MAG TPA: peptide chain release factor N(5)-glutamine methyltransferase [Smithellaceae bacterium]|nr:peptide chain release factor N(5)-glutamine methyltransferase [Smithellaceae bacterium]HRS88909.1 peptide chain release factor N(5)-glutamine methyltransferase [Smithellaceae bacterium]HRV26248.1 peptide chain release factor N(5)-glutamine methyltransferase [Smithellaceae bacterium]